MPNMQEVKVSWQNWPGAPGYSTFYFDTASSTAPASVRAFFEAIKAFIPAGITIQVAGSGDVISDATGIINNGWSTATPAVVNATGGSGYAGGSGAVVHWLTSDVVGTRRVRGRTFLVPLINTAFDTGGSLSSGAITTLQTAASGLITAEAGNFLVWHRPTGFSSGSSHDVVGSSVPDLAVVLRSRRQ